MSNFCAKMTSSMSSRTCYTKLNFDVPHVRSLSLRRDTNMLTHECLPHTFMITSIIPILKTKMGETNAKNNNRSIAIVTAVSKISELCLATIMDAHLVTSDNHFGFKQKHSTDLCIWLNLFNSIAIILIALCILVFLMPLKSLTGKPLDHKHRV